MNIIYIHSHDTGRYVQPYGHAVPTPNLQRLAEEGILFRKAFCAAPTCSPSRASLLTGQSPHSSGQLGLANRGFYLHDPHKHLAHTMKANGYTTALFGIQHLHMDPSQLGYDLIVETNHETGRYDAKARTDDAVNFLAAPPSKPFFMTVGYAETHRVFAAAGPTEDPRYTLPPAPMPDTAETRQDMADFKASARILDENIGRVLNALDEYGLAEETLVICTTDHGLAFPFMKCSLTDHGMGVMLIMRGPGGFQGGRVVDAMLSQIDIYPTICAAAGIEAPAWLQGKSFLPVVRQEAEEVNEEIFAEVNYHAAYEPKRAVRSQRWKYIRRYDDRGHLSFPNIDDGLSKRRLVQEGLTDYQVADEQLYDLAFDPNEGNNLIDDPDHAEIAADMRARLARWMEATDDPLLNGPVPAPENATVNRPDDPNPGDIDNYAPPDPWVLRTKVDQLRTPDSK